MREQKPLELILARNLLASLSTPAFLVGEEGLLLFFNEAAGVLLGRNFEDSGSMTVDQWTSEFGPVDRQGSRLAYDEIPLTVAIREGRPAHFDFRIRIAGEMREVAVSGLPIVGPGGSSGAIVFFWPAKPENEEER